MTVRELINAIASQEEVELDTPVVVYHGQHCDRKISTVMRVAFKKEHNELIVICKEEIL